jgi:hypothetical protein
MAVVSVLLVEVLAAAAVAAVMVMVLVVLVVLAVLVQVAVVALVLAAVVVRLGWYQETLPVLRKQRPSSLRTTLVGTFCPYLSGRASTRLCGLTFGRRTPRLRQTAATAAEIARSCTSSGCTTSWQSTSWTTAWWVV